MAFYVGDIPAADMVWEPARNGDPIDLAPFTDVVVSLWTEAGTPVDTLGFLGTLDPVEGTVTVEWPGQSPFDAPGLYALQVILEGPTARERLAPVLIVVQALDGWHTLDSARDDWPSAPDQDTWLYTMLAISRQQVAAYAETLTEGTRPPISYRQGQLMQARNIWNASKVDPASGGMGEDSFMIRPFPLDWMVRQVLRPKSAVPAVG